MNLLWLLLLPVVDSLRTGTEADQQVGGDTSWKKKHLGKWSHPVIHKNP